jgi:tripartite-type tricarboxylate transporter receptor subunit TctC
MATSGEMVILPAMQSARYDTLRDFVPVALVSVTPIVIVAHAGAPFSTLQELIAAARAKPGAYSYASPSTGSPHHVTGEWLKHLNGINLVHVPYKGGAPAVADVAGGQLPIGIVAITPALPHIKSGKVKVIAVTSATRSRLAPEWPTVAEQGLPGFDTSIWVGLFAPAGTPAPMVTRLATEVSRSLAIPEVREKLAAQGGEPGSGAQQEFAAYIKAEITKYRKIIQDAGVKPE